MNLAFLCKPRYMEIIVDIQISRALTWPLILYCPLFPYGVATASDLYAVFVALIN